MTDEVICSGCQQTVPWPAGHSVKTDTLWLNSSGKARRVTFMDLTSDRVFHQCPPADRVAQLAHGAVDLAGLATHVRREDNDHPEWVKRRLRLEGGQALPGTQADQGHRGVLPVVQSLSVILPRILFREYSSDNAEIR